MDLFSSEAEWLMFFLMQSLWSDAKSMSYSTTDESMKTIQGFTATTVGLFAVKSFNWSFYEPVKLSEVDWCWKRWHFILVASLYSPCYKSLVKISVSKKTSTLNFNPVHRSSHPSWSQPLSAGLSPSLRALALSSPIVAESHLRIWRCLICTAPILMIPL